jgi:DNA mismatch endonuclease (patch repair protein)
MSNIRGKNTAPERQVRSILHQLGFRFRLHRRDLPGVPDIVLPKLKTVVFVHGCFWHQHDRCKKATVPTTNTTFWTEKFKRNKLRDRLNKEKLTSMNWQVIIIWECELLRIESVKKKLLRKLR